MKKAAHTKVATDAKGRKARSDVLWAVIVVGKRSSWINSFTVAPQRQLARQRYLEQWINPADGESHFRNKMARLAKVRIEELE
jgi:hypothetical protein